MFSGLFCGYKPAQTFSNFFFECCPRARADSENESRADILLVARNAHEYHIYRVVRDLLTYEQLYIPNIAPKGDKH